MTVQQKLHLPIRTSTAVLILLFAGLLVLYFWVRPTGTSQASNTGQDSPQTGQQATTPPSYSPAPTPTPSTTSPRPSATPSSPSPRPSRSSPVPTPTPSTPGSTPLPSPAPTASTPAAAPSG